MTVGRTEPSPLALARNEKWSFRPILIGFRCIGIDLLESSNKLHRRFCLFYSMLCLLLNLAAEVDILNFLKSPELFIMGEDKLETTITSSWNAVIDFVNYAVHSLGSHLILLTFFRARLERLLNVMMHRCNSQWNFYTKLYRLSIFGVIYIALTVSYSLAIGHKVKRWFMLRYTKRTWCIYVTDFRN